MNVKNLNEFLESFTQGQCSRAADFLGSRLTDKGALFRVWAPDAVQVFVSGDFNGWSPQKNPMHYLSGGIWELEISELDELSPYKYVIAARDGQKLWKADPYAVFSQLRPETSSVLYELEGYQWKDEKWLAHRRSHKIYSSPLNVYELHLGSWRLNENGEFLTYRQLAEQLIPYVKAMSFTHIELMPLTEYPYDASWGYQCTGYFSATARYGTPQDLMFLVDACHQAGIGVLMDWVPAHFPKDAFGLVEFDGSRLYEDSDPVMAEHPSWGTRIFDYAKGEVRSFLISSALFWLEKYHIDGLRVDAVASMLYLDYDRQGSSYRPNKYGNRENLDAVHFLRDLNAACFGYDDSILMIAEESTAWPQVTDPAETGGLGFNLKWNMGWMNDSLRYLKTDPYFRSGSHNNLTFSLVYAFSENFILPLSHDEVVHMKGSIIGKAPGTRDQKLASIRAFWLYMLAHPGKKILFMGVEIGQESEWNFEASLPWELLEYPDKSQFHEFFIESNKFYKSSKPLWEIDFQSEGFKWLCPDEREKNIIGFARRDSRGSEIVFVCNFSGVTAKNFRLGVSGPGSYVVTLSSDETRFGGTGLITEDNAYNVEKIPYHNQNQSILMSIPPLTAVFMKRSRSAIPQPEPSTTKKSGKASAK